MLLQTSRPCTVYISISVNDIPRNFKLYKDGQLDFFRPTGGKLTRLKFNVPIPGTYESNVDFKIVKIVDLEYPSTYPTLPDHEREDYRDYTIVKNEELTGTPARIFRKRGIIETSRQFDGLPTSMQKFIILHEIGHFYYKTEEYCDLYALIEFLKLGYNRSTAYYTMENILHVTPVNIKRLQFLINNIQKTQKEKI